MYAHPAYVEEDDCVIFDDVDYGEREVCAQHYFIQDGIIQEAPTIAVILVIAIMAGSLIIIGVDAKCSTSFISSPFMD